MNVGTAQEASVSVIAILLDSEILNRLKDLEQHIIRITDQVSIHSKSLDQSHYRAIPN